MAIDVSVPRSRRAVISGAIAGLAATAAQALGRPGPVAATDGFAVIQGADNSGSVTTLIRSTTSTAFQGLADASSGTAYGVRGRSNSTAGAGVVGQVVALSGTNYGVWGLSASPSGTGVRGEAPNIGLRGFASANTGSTFGVYGTTGSTTGGTAGVFGVSIGRGVYGLASGPDARGVYGVSGGGSGTVGVEGYATQAGAIGVKGRTSSLANTCIGVEGYAADGRGVHGWSNTGTGVHAHAVSASGIGLKVSGQAVFSRSGKAIVPAGASSVTVPVTPLLAAAIVMATIQGPGASGVYVRNVLVSGAGTSFTITLSKAVAVNTPLGWFVVN